MTAKQKILKDLNEQQVQPVKNIYGPIYVVAAPGSGKTATMTRRVAYMIESGIPAEEILMFTFTKKASEEILSRIIDFVGKKARDVTVGTYHSICYRILRKHADLLGYDKNFTIYDEDNKKNLLKKIIDKDIHPMPLVINVISGFKTKGMTPSEITKKAQNTFEISMAKYYTKYQEELKKCSAMDFDDLLMQCIRLMQKHPHVRELLNKQYKYIMVDEFQDSSASDIEFIRLMTGPQENLCIVFDDEQCWDENGAVQTSKGIKLIKDIQVGDEVLTVQNTKGAYFPVTNKSKAMKVNRKIKIITESGKEIIVTRNHKMFASDPEFYDTIRYVYLMYREDKGFRIGMMSGGKCKNMFTRAHAEKAERIWLLGRYENSVDASYFEQYYSLKYQIPTAPFFHKGRGILSDQTKLDLIFHNFGLNGHSLLEDLDMSFENPNYVSQGTSRSSFSRSNVNITMNGSKNSTIVRYEKNGEVVRHQFSIYSEAFKFAQKLYNSKDASIIREKYRYKGRESLNVIPASQLTIDMSIPVVSREGEEHKLEKIQQLVFIDSDSSVYHIEVEKTGILVVNDVASHNSIFGFRGADIDAVLKAINTQYNFTKYVLSQNYRSTKTIVAAAREVIQNNDCQIKKTVFTENEQGDPVILYEEINDVAEANRVVKVVKGLVRSEKMKYNDIAVLYRMQYLSRSIEEAFLRNSIPYEVVSGNPYYSRREIKDVLSYVKLIHNPYDRESFVRAIGIPKRGIGDKSIQKILSEQIPGGTLMDAAKKSKLKGKTKSGLENFVALLETLTKLYESNPDPATLVREIIRQTKYEEYLLDNDENAEERINNLIELINIAAEYDCLSEFISNLTLNYMTEEEKSGGVKLITMHSAKGLEYPAVILIGVNEGVTPHRLAETKSKLEEERRLFYVAMTRAEKYLFLLRSKMSCVQGKTIRTAPSRFLKEISDAYLYRFAEKQIKGGLRKIS